MRDTLTLSEMPRKRKMCTGLDKDWRKTRAKIRGDSENSLSPRLNAAQIINLFSPGIKGAYINKKGCCVKESWSAVAPRPASLIINHVIDAVYMISRVFCPKDPRALVRAVAERLQSCLGVVSKRRDFKDWSEHSLVKLLLHEYQSSKKNTRRKEVLSWVAATPVQRKWIKQLFNVSYDVIRTAQRHASVWLPGGRKIQLSLNNTAYRRSARYMHLKKWLVANMEFDPAGKKKGGRRLRFVRRHSGHKLYLIDIERQMPGLKPYSRSAFYKHPLQKGIQDTKCLAGLCVICTRWGVRIFIDLEQLAMETTMLLKSVTEFDLIAWKKSFKRVKNYFVRGGMFQRCLKKSCNNVHWCLQYALSHPSNACYQQKCDHDHKEVHTHTHNLHIHTHSAHSHTRHSHTYLQVDHMCLMRDSLWSQLYNVIDNTLASEDDATVSLLAKTGIVGEDANTTFAKKLHNVRKKLQWQRAGHDKFVGHLMLTTMQKQKHFQLRGQVNY